VKLTGGDPHRVEVLVGVLVGVELTASGGGVTASRATSG
jgi:hypothetical protein